VVVGSLDDVGVMAPAFDDARVGAVSSALRSLSGDLGEGFHQRGLSLVRGKNPPAL
jgi:hypothetical protein